MLARRIIAVSPDLAFGKQLATALEAAGGAVDARQTLGALGDDELSAALWVIHVDGALAGAASELLARLTGASRVIAVVPRSSLASVVEIMQASERVAGMIIAEDFNALELRSMAARILTGDIFGLDKIMPAGTEIHAQLVHDFKQRTQCLAKISEFVASVGVARNYQASIEQCLDEMLMNALYDAPTDDQGKSVFSEITPKTRVTLRIEQTVVVQYAYDGKQLALSVRDAFGSLDRQTVLRVLHKCLHAEQKIDSKAGGAGVGLYLMLNSSTRIYFNVIPGVATEAVCTFDLAKPKLLLEQFGCFVEPSDVTGTLATARRPAGTVRLIEVRQPLSRRQIAIGGAAIAAIALIGVAAWPRIFREPPQQPQEHGRTRDDVFTVIHRDFAAKVDVDSEPTGATVEIDGKRVGATPVTLTWIAPGTTASLVLKQVGYRDARVRVQAPLPGQQRRVVQRLEGSDDFVRVHLVSDPPGARVVNLGEAKPRAAGDRTYTPTDVFVAANQVQRFVLTMPDHAPFEIAPFTPARSAVGLQKGGKLVELPPPPPPLPPP